LVRRGRSSAARGSGDCLGFAGHVGRINETGVGG